MSEINNNNFAIPFITFNNSTQKFIISPESKKILCNSSYSKIGIISLIGKYRTGKSFLLNKILQKKQCFNVGSSIKPCTKGIWLYSNPLLISNSFCQEFPVFFIDSEGLCAYDEEINHDSKIFLISILISSLLIYNSFGTIDEQALNNLSFIINLAKNFNEKNFFPSFLWILRDFSLKLEDNEGNLITAKEYLEIALNEQKNEEKNYVRNVIKNYFKERDCFTIVRPVENESDLQRLNCLENEKIRPEFLEQIEILREKIFMNVKPKNFEGKKFFSGENFFFFVENVVECVNDGNVPVIENCWNYVINIEMNKKIEENVKNYRKKLDDFKREKFNENEYFFELEKFNLNLNDEIIKNFKKFENLNENFEFLKKLKKNLKNEFKNFNDENKFLNKEKISNEIELKLNEIFKNLNEKNFLLFFNDLIKIKDEFYLKIKNFDLNEIFIEKIIFYIKKFVEEILKKNNEKIIFLNNENEKLKLKIENFNLNIEKLNNEIKSKEKENLLEKQKNFFLENEFKKFNNEKNLLFNVFNNTNEIKNMIKNLNKNFNNFSISDSNFENFNNENFNNENFNNLNNNFNNNFIKISIIGKNIKKDEKNKLFLEYLIEVKTEKKNYKISKKFLQFSLLNKTLKNMFKNLINLPETGSLFLNVNEMNENSFHDNKINQLNFYVNELCKIDVVVNSEPFKNFFELENEHKNINENVLVENKKIIIEKQQKNFYSSNKKNF